MGDSKVDFRLSEDTVKSLEAIEGVAPLVERVRDICASIVAMPERSPVTPRKKELNRFLRSLQGLAEAMDNLSTDAYVDLLEQSERMNNMLAQSVDFAAVHLMRLEATKAAFLVSATISNLVAQKGRRAAEGKRFLAVLVAMEFRSQGLSLTSYESGPFMRVLEVLFKEIYPEAKQAGYFRHGKWAINQFPSG